MKLEEFIKLASNGTFFTIEFLKRTTGERRVMNARRGVYRHVKGVGRTFNPAEKDLLGVYDMQNEGYRLVSLDGLISLRFMGRYYMWDNQIKEFIEHNE